ncbi:MAG: TonB-dependent receptor, partial [Gammaproteobacteria bacterium]|nr:TonB-dependent receptor [Gammaproteobacteria bacterium]
MTLVNGRRFVSANTPSIFGESGGLQVDFNVIPVALVERIETIGVGGAPIYGSDAIAGTINVILKDRFEGVQLNMRRGTTEEGDGDFESISLVAGANFSDDRGNVTMSMESFRQDGLFRKARPRYTENDPFWGSEEGDGFRRIYRDQRINLFTDGGLIDGGAFTIPSLGIGAMSDGNFYQFDTNSNLVPYTPGTDYPGSAFFALGGSGPDFFDNVAQIQSPLTREVFTTRMNYDITDRVTFSADVLFADTWADELVNQGGFQTWVFGGTSNVPEFPIDHPFLDPAAQALLAGLPGGEQTFFLHRFNNDIIDSSNERQQFLWHATAGLEGDFDVGDRNFVWSVSATHGESDGFTKSEGIIDDRFLSAIDVRRLTAADLAAVDADPDAAEQTILGFSGTPGAGVGDIVCESVYQAALGNVTGTSGSGLTDGDLPAVQGCAPLNLFGEGVRSDAAREWVTADQMTQSEIEQSVFNINFGGDLFELPGGWMAFNVGYENRDEYALFSPGSGTEVPISRSSPFAATGGDYETDEFYGEIAIPLVSADMDIPLVEFLELDGAFRQIENSLAGDADVWTAGIRYAPVQDISFRANITESIRAPSLVELFAPQNQTFGFADDPCDFRFVNDGPVPATRAANCAADIAGYDPATFTSNIVNATAIGKTGGNPNLINESAESYTIGLTFEPRWVERLLFTADYINIELTDAIQELELEQLMASCYDSAGFPNVTSCGNWTRDAAGQVIDFTQGQANAALFAYEQLEFGANYDFEVGDFFGLFSDTWGARDMGNFEARMRLNHPLERRISVVGEPNDNTIGGFNDPDWSGTFDFIWTGQNSRVFWRMLWQDDALIDPTGNDQYEDLNGNEVFKTDARFITNATFSYNLDAFFPGAPERTMVQLSGGNLF